MTTENNKLIAEFMKLVYKYDGMYHNIQLFNEDGTPKRSGRLIKSEWTLWNPHKDWNDLMQVVEKIEDLNYSIEINKQEENDYQCLIVKKDILIQKFSNIKIEAVYNACVEFIKWYNLQIK